MQYKVLTQKDRFFGGKFDPEKLEAALNSYGSEGWTLVGVESADVSSWGTNRQEIIFILGRD